MLYIGNFNYDDSQDDAQNYCLLPVIVEAGNPDEALDKIAGLFEHLRETSDLLDGANEIYMDSLIELADHPEQPILTQWTKVVPAGEGLSMVNAILPAEDPADDRSVVGAYSWYDGDDAAGSEDVDADDLDDDDYVEEDPFMVFDDEE